MTDITEKVASLEADAKEANDYTNMPMEVDPRYILELIAHIRALSEERDSLRKMVAKWRSMRREYDGSAADAINDFADELESLLIQSETVND